MKKGLRKRRKEKRERLSTFTFIYEAAVKRKKEKLRR